MPTATFPVAIDIPGGYQIEATCLAENGHLAEIYFLDGSYVEIDGAVAKGRDPERVALGQLLIKRIETEYADDILDSLRRPYRGLRDLAPWR